MKKILLLLLFIFAGNAVSQNVKITDRLSKKMQSLNPLEYTRVLVLLKDRVDIEALDAELYRIDAPIDYRAETVINTLKQKAAQTQQPILNYLNAEKNHGKVKQFINFWVTNLIFVEATPDVLNQIVKRSDVEVMDLDAQLDYDRPLHDFIPSPNSTESVETGLKVIKADSLWMRGITGAGRTVMHIDTGVDGLHPALAPRWWGNNGRPWYHAWFDPIAPSSTSPFDCGSHGTHTMGIMCGRNSATGDTVGVAPDAFWMSAGITDCPGSSNPAMNIAAYQWAMDPDSNAATMNMPDVISCSWQDPSSSSDQCTNSIYRTTLSAVEAAGIAVVFSAGNLGPGVSTISPPKNINIDSVNVFCVGNVNGNAPPYLISNSSSRGPSICGGTGTLLIKPEVSAPGTNVRSTIPNNSYGNNSGTSMASPHVAGCIALLKQVVPNMTGKQIKAILLSTATDLGTPGEDNDYGKGLVNVYAAYLRLGIFPLNAFSLQTPAAGSRIVSFPGSSQTVTLTWDTSATGAQYKWIFGSPTVPPRRLTVPSSSNSLTLTLGQLDNLLAAAGVNQGDSLVGQWDVWAFRVNPVDSMKASNGPRSLTLRRGVPALTAFNLVSPPSGTTITTSVFNTSNININWSRSGQGVTYKWKFGNPTISTVRLSLPSNSSGFDTVLTIANNALDGLLQGLGLNPGDSLVGQYAVWAYNATDSVKSTQTYALTLKRQARGDVIVVYDSTVTLCRTSRDSIVNNLSNMSATFDLYNRRGNTTGTASISFRGYRKVIILGEGTSVMSNILKDSLKSYLAAGTPTVKSKLIIMAEDVGYHLDRTASAFYDSAFARSTLGFAFIADRIGTGIHGLVGVTTNPNAADSCAGPFPELLRRSPSLPQSQLHNLYRYRLFPDSMNSVGRISPTFNVAIMGVDVESLRRAVDSPPGSPVFRFLKGSMDYVDGLLTGVDPTSTSMIPTEYSLSQNFPNPFNPTTKITFSLPKQEKVTLKIYDVLGKEVMTLINEDKPAGVYNIEFNATNFASGAYFYRIEAGDFRDIKRMILIK